MSTPRRYCAPAGHDTELLGRYPGGNCAECSRQRSRQWHVDNPGRIWARKLTRHYGITVAEYEEMLDQQDGQCMTCGAEPEQRLCVDHDHQSGHVRGLLCHRCNRVLGLVGDDRKLLGTLVLYLNGGRA